MTIPHHTAPPVIPCEALGIDGAALEAVTDADREWFLAHPARRYRLRPTSIHELIAGQAMTPGSWAVVATMGRPEVRMRIPVGRPPLALRQDTDRVCAALVGRLDAAGYTINGKPFGVALRELRKAIEARAA